MAARGLQGVLRVPPLRLHPFGQQLPVAHQVDRVVLQHPCQSLEPLLEQGEGQVEHQQGGYREQRAGERKVIGQESGGDALAHDQEHHEVEAGQIAQGALPGDPEQHQQSEIDHEGTNDRVHMNRSYGRTKNETGSTAPPGVPNLPRRRPSFLGTKSTRTATEPLPAAGKLSRWPAGDTRISRGSGTIRSISVLRTNPESSSRATSPDCRASSANSRDWVASSRTTRW